MEDLSLDQLRVFATVAQSGSFAAAARQLGRAPSAITYAIQALEAHFGIALFDRSGYRVTLNDTGHALLPRAERILRETSVLQAQACGLTGGLESAIVIAVDALFPMETIMPVLHGFAARFASVAPRFLVDASAATAQLAMNGNADFGILVDFTSHDSDLVQISLDPVELVAVAEPNHPLAKLPSPLTAEDVRDHVQIVLSDRTLPAPEPEWRDRGVLALQTWRVTDLATKYRMLLAGLGWGSMPRHQVDADLRQGRLYELVVNQWDSADRLPHLPASVVYQRRRALGPATRWLIQEIGQFRRISDR